MLPVIAQGRSHGRESGRSPNPSPKSKVGDKVVFECGIDDGTAGDARRMTMSWEGLARAIDPGEVLYLAPYMARPARWGLKLYDRYETHWTGLGAYQGYVALMQRLQDMGAVQEGPRPLDAFRETPEPASGPPRNLALIQMPIATGVVWVIVALIDRFGNSGRGAGAAYGLKLILPGLTTLFLLIQLAIVLLGAGVTLPFLQAH